MFIQDSFSKLSLPDIQGTDRDKNITSPGFQNDNSSGDFGTKTICLYKIMFCPVMKVDAKKICLCIIFKLF